jgi:hypothetical protein
MLRRDTSILAYSVLKVSWTGKYKKQWISTFFETIDRRASSKKDVKIF